MSDYDRSQPVSTMPAYPTDTNSRAVQAKDVPTIDEVVEALQEIESVRARVAIANAMLSEAKANSSEANNELSRVENTALDLLSRYGLDSHRDKEVPF